MPTSPPLPSGLNNGDLGDIFGWGGGHEEARQQIGRLSKDDLLSEGLTAGTIRAWAEYLSAMARKYPTNPSAAGRADLLWHLVSLFED